MPTSGLAGRGDPTQSPRQCSDNADARIGKLNRALPLPVIELRHRFVPRVAVVSGYRREDIAHVLLPLVITPNAATKCFFFHCMSTGCHKHHASGWPSRLWATRTSVTSPFNFSGSVRPGTATIATMAASSERIKGTDPRQAARGDSFEEVCQRNSHRQRRRDSSPGRQKCCKRNTAVGLGLGARGYFNHALDGKQGAGGRADRARDSASGSVITFWVRSDTLPYSPHRRSKRGLIRRRHLSAPAFWAFRQGTLPCSACRHGSCPNLRTAVLPCLHLPRRAVP